MQNNTLIDTAIIRVKAGNGGDGMVSFRREKYIPKGGPDGGNGGKGGSIFALSDHNLGTLVDFRSKRTYTALDGERGGKRNKGGGNSEDIYVKIPVGTKIYELTEHGEFLIADVVKSGEIIPLARGGVGGKGNTVFKSSTNRTPLQYTKGQEGEERQIRLEIKMIADVGIIGYPNAGKSTLINTLSNANAKTANYPFTTLSPNLGTTRIHDKDIIFADIPGLIEGASEGKGLGDEFLRHIERTKLLVHIVDPYDTSIDSSEMPAFAYTRYSKVRLELSNYLNSITRDNPLPDKQEIVVINKLDISEVKESFSKIAKIFSEKKIEILGISAATGDGVKELLEYIYKKMVENDAIEMERVANEGETAIKTMKVYNISDLPNKRMVFYKKEVKEKA